MTMHKPDVQYQTTDTSNTAYSQVIKLMAPLIVVVPILLGTTLAAPYAAGTAFDLTPSSGNSFAFSQEVTENTIIAAVEDLTLKLASQQTDLSNRAAEILMKNRWDWYE